VHNTMFLLWCGDVLPKVYIFVPRLVSGTGRGFGSAPQQKHTRYAQCRADNDGASNFGTFACRTNPRDTEASKRAKLQ
jgi:hypothetical protein